MPATIGVALAFLLACPGSGVQAQGPQGADLAGRLGCLACHSLQGRGGQFAAPLDGVGARLTPRELAVAVAFPRQRHPLAKMPSYAYLPPVEQAALVKYLESLK
jgi:mono/diheme cytochrome c family protein